MTLFADTGRGHFREACLDGGVGHVRGRAAVARLALHAAVDHGLALEDAALRTGHVAAEALLLLVGGAETIEGGRMLRLRPRVVDGFVTLPAAVGPGVRGRIASRGGLGESARRVAGEGRNHRGREKM